MPRRPLTGAEAAFVSGRRLGRIATVGPDGMPHVVPVMYAYAEGAFWFSADPGDRKVKDLTSNGRAALVVDEPPPVKAGVTVRGTAELLEDGPRFEAAQDHLRAVGAAGRRPMAPGEQVYVRLLPAEVASWKVEPTP